MKSEGDEYVTVRIPKQLADEIDEIIRSETLGYRTRAEMVKEAIRLRIERALTRNSIAMTSDTFCSGYLQIINHNNLKVVKRLVQDRSYTITNILLDVSNTHYYINTSFHFFQASKNLNLHSLRQIDGISASLGVRFSKRVADSRYLGHFSVLTCTIQHS
jgi:metal-responsive CopG/Arc/MetJ family transcriptional regulator